VRELPELVSEEPVVLAPTLFVVVVSAWRSASSVSALPPRPAPDDGAALRASAVSISAKHSAARIALVQVALDLASRLGTRRA
jgi:hypothetical protein